MDLRGAVVKVIRSSSCPQLVDLEGILTRETHATFEIVTRDGTARTIRKNGSVVNLSFKGTLVSLDGTRMVGRKMIV